MLFITYPTSEFQICLRYETHKMFFYSKVLAFLLDGR
jgi:hypothetical protein